MASTPLLNQVLIERTVQHCYIKHADGIIINVLHPVPFQMSCWEWLSVIVPALASWRRILEVCGVEKVGAPRAGGRGRPVWP